NAPPTRSGVSRSIAKASCSSSSFLAWCAPSEENDLIGFSQTGNDICVGNVASGSSTSIRAKLGYSSITFCCSSRLQYLCSHLTTASKDLEGSPYFLHRIGTIMLTAKSQ